MTLLLASWGQTTTPRVNLHLQEMHSQVKQAVDYFVLLCASVLREAAGEVGVTGGAPVFHVILLLSRKKITNMSQGLQNQSSNTKNSRS